MPKLTASRLIDLALIYAIQDREGMVETCHPSDPERAKAADLVKQFRAYHKRRFGREHLTPVERLASQATAVPIHKIPPATAATNPNHPTPYRPCREP